jgi:dienelactone hydrolase
LWPWPEKRPLNAQVTQPLRRDGYSIQNVALETWPEFYLVGNLYRPLGRTGLHPGLLCPHGHWKAGRFQDSVEASVPGRAINFARQGFVVFSYSMVGYNETGPFILHRFDEPKHQLWGFGSAGLQLWNSIRALDFLISQPDVDPARIGATGASGGGTQTFLLTAVDQRVKAAAPVNMISAHFQGGCVCENPPLLRLDCNNVEIGSLAAPRPLLMISTSGDWTKNTPEIEFPAVRQIYRLFGAEDRVHNVHLDFPHNYNRQSREAAYAWLGRWFLNTTGPIAETPFQVEEQKMLEARLPTTPAALDTLFAGFVEQARLQIEAAGPESWRDMFAYRETFATALKHALMTGPLQIQPVLTVSLPSQRTEAVPAVLIVHSGAQSSQATVRDLTQNYLEQGRAVFSLEPYPAGRDFTPPPKVNHWHTYNPSTDSRRVAEIRAAVQQILHRPDITALDLVGIEGAGPLTLLARAFEPGVRNTVVDFAESLETDESFLKLAFIPLLRRAGDFKTAVALIAPAPLTLCGLPEGELKRWTIRLYRAAGASDMVAFREGREAGDNGGR